MPVRLSKFLSITILTILTAAPAAGAAVGDHVWSQGYDAGDAVAIDGAGNVLATGLFFGTIDFGGGPLTASNVIGGDVFLAKFDSNGNHVFSAQITPTGSIDVDGLAADPAGNWYITGTIFSGDVDFGGGPLSGSQNLYVAKLSPGGGHVWSATYGGSAEAYAIDATASHVALAGSVADSVDFGGGQLTGGGFSDPDAIVAVLTSAGAHVWSAEFGDTDAQRANRVRIDDSGNVVVTGGARGIVDFGGGPLAANALDLFLAKFVSGGAHSWSTMFDGTFGSGSILEMGLDIDASGNVLLAGELDGSCDFGDGTVSSVNGSDAFVATFDASGNHTLSSTYPGQSYQTVLGACWDGLGNIVFGGTTGGAIDFGGGVRPFAGFSDIYAACVDASGGHVWSQTYGTASPEYDCRPCTFPNGDILLQAGGSSGLDFGGGALSQATFALVKLEGNGVSTAAMPGMPAHHLGQNRPNPFNPSTTIEFTLERSARVELQIFDVRGRLVRTLVSGVSPAGVGYAEWDGRDERGQTVASGVYYYALVAGPFLETRRMVLVK